MNNDKKVVVFSDPISERPLTDIKIEYVYLNGKWTITTTQEEGGLYRTELKEPETGKSIIIVMPRYADSVNLARAMEANKEPEQEMDKNSLDLKSIIGKNSKAMIGAGSGVLGFLLGWFIGSKD